MSRLSALTFTRGVSGLAVVVEAIMRQMVAVTVMRTSGKEPLKPLRWSQTVAFTLNSDSQIRVGPSFQRGTLRF
jgi:hypothetical protein